MWKTFTYLKKKLYSKSCGNTFYDSNYMVLHENNDLKISRKQPPE